MLKISDNGPSKAQQQRRHLPPLPCPPAPPRLQASGCCPIPVASRTRSRSQCELSMERLYPWFVPHSPVPVPPPAPPIYRHCRYVCYGFSFILYVFYFISLLIAAPIAPQPAACWRGGGFLSFSVFPLLASCIFECPLKALQFFAGTAAYAAALCAGNAVGCLVYTTFTHTHTHSYTH